MQPQNYLSGRDDCAHQRTGYEMAQILIIQAESILSPICRAALVSAGHELTLIETNTEAYEYLVRQHQTPDIVIVNVQNPGSTERLVLDALGRLPHLEHAQVLAIGFRHRATQLAARFWGADLVLPLPVLPNTLLVAIQSLVASRQPDTPGLTRVWWDGEEAVFVRWTETSLVFFWPDSTDTAVKIPRGAVVRLMKKGVLKVEGYMPVWVRLEPTTAEADRVVKETLPTKVAPTSPAAGTPEKAPAEKADRFNVVARLIRRLSGGADSRLQRSPGQV